MLCQLREYFCWVCILRNHLAWFSRSSRPSRCNFSLQNKRHPLNMFLSEFLTLQPITSKLRDSQVWPLQQLEQIWNIGTAFCSRVNWGLLDQYFIVFLFSQTTIPLINNPDKVLILEKATQSPWWPFLSFKFNYCGLSLGRQKKVPLHFDLAML